MTLQDLVNQNLYAARKAALGIVLGFSLVGAPKVAYAQNPVDTVMKQALSPVQSSTSEDIYKQPEEQGVVITDYGLNPPLLPINQTNFLPVKPILDPNIIEYLNLTPKQRAEQERQERINEHRQAIAELNEQLERTEQNGFPSLSSLKEHYHDFEQRNGSTHYKAKSLVGYYVHYPQSHSIYYVERKDKTNGRSRTTVAYSIADEDENLLFRANEQGEMVRVESHENKKFENTVQLNSNERNLSIISSLKTDEPSEPPQATAQDAKFFDNLYGCFVRNGLRSATGVGVGSLAVISPLIALYIRRRRRLR